MAEAAIDARFRAKPVLRRSTLEAQLACPQYLNTPSIAAGFGIAMHACIAEWTWACVDKPDGPLANMDSAVQTIKQRPFGLLPAEQEKLSDLAYRFEATHDANVATLEGCEWTLLWDAGDAYVSGTLDRVDRLGHDAVLITDWKSGWYRDDNSWQMRVYAALICAQRPHLRRVVVRTDYIRLNDGITQAEYTRAELREFWQDTIRPAVSLVLERQGGPPVGGSGCRYCGRRWTCAMAVAPFNNEPTSQEAADEVVGELVRLEAAADERRAALRAFYREREPAIVNGMEVGYLASREPTISIPDPIAAVDWLSKHHGWVPSDALLVDRRRLSPMVRDALVRDGLATVVPPEEAETQFRMRAAHAKE